LWDDHPSGDASVCPIPLPESWPSFGQSLQLPVTHNNFDPVFRTQMFGQLLRYVYRPVLATGAAKRHHQVLKAAPAIFTDTRVDQRLHVRQESMNALLLIKIFDDGSISSSKRLEALFAPRVWETASIEDEAPAVSAFVI